MKATFSLVFVLFDLFYNPIDSGAVQFDESSIDEALKNNAFVLINFYANWCRFSNMLEPIFDEAADKVREKFANSEKKVVLGKVDCERQDSLGTRFHISKYPTLKYVVNGQLAKKEYRGQRSTEAFIQFVEEQIRDPVKEFQNLDELKDIDAKKRHIIGYFEEQKSLDYQNFRKVAETLKEECSFYAGFGETVKHMHPPGQSVVAYRPNRATSNEDDKTYTGALYNQDQLLEWCQEVCIPLVREITFENAEELTEEGLPFLILFHKPNDVESIKQFSDAVKNQVYGDKPYRERIKEENKENVNFLTADGRKFAHPLYHLGKSENDLPLIAIDSFRHMYLFKQFSDIHKPGKLKKFLEDLYSGKLHREFHYGPDEPNEEEDESELTDQPSQEDGGPPINTPGKPEPPPSQFQHLQPSKNRYTLLRDEF